LLITVYNIGLQDVLIREYESTHDNMKENSNFEEINRKLRQILVKSHRFSIVLDQQNLVDPIENNIVYACDRI
jgi:hypothetical protein